MAEIGYLNNCFINLYSEDNPILSKNDDCYFMINGVFNIHRPLICKGIIIEDKITDGFNKIYFIRLLEIIESPKIIDKFINNQIFNIVLFEKNILSTSIKQVKLTSDLPADFFNKNLFKIEAFFVRKDIDQLIKLRQQYVEIVKNDIENQLKDCIELLT